MASQVKTTSSLIVSRRVRRVSCGRAHASSWIVGALLAACSGDSMRVVELDSDIDPASGAGGSGQTAGESMGGSSGDVGGAGGSGAEAQGGSSSEEEPDDTEQGGSGGDDDPSPAQPTEFWDDGVSIEGTANPAEERFLGVAFGAGGRVYAAGYTGASVGANRSMLIAAFDAEGAPDGEFGTDGNVIVDLSAYEGSPDDPETEANDADGSIEEATDIALQSNGQIIVVGRAEDPSVDEPDRSTPADIVLLRLNPDGTRDDSFGNEGLVVLDPGGGSNDLAWGVDVDANDRIYVFGHGTTSDPERTDRDRYCWRLDADGALDESFADGGEFVFDIPQGSSTLALDDNSRRGAVVPAAAGGGVVLGGYTNVAGRNQIVLVYLDENGAPKTTFSSDGVVRLAPFPTGMAEAYGAAVQSDGSFVTTGYGNVDVERSGGSELLDMVSFRVKPDGNFDPSWGINGSAIYDTGGEDRGRALQALPDDRIIIGGTATVTAGNKDAMLLLLDQNGNPVPEFAPGVHKGYDFGGTNEEFRAIDVAPDASRIAAAGFSSGRAGPDRAILVLVPVSAAAE